MKRASPAGLRLVPIGNGEIDSLVELIKELARFEKLPPPDAAARRRLRAAFDGGEPRIQGLLAQQEGRAVGYALFFYTFSTFLARPTLYLEDLYVQPEARGGGVGLKLFEACRTIGRKRGCARMEWSVLDWNRPAHRFYRKLGARRLEEWQVYRMLLRKGAF